MGDERQRNEEARRQDEGRRRGMRGSMMTRRSDESEGEVSGLVVILPPIPLPSHTGFF